MAKLRIRKLENFPLPITVTLPDGTEEKIVFTVKHKKAKEVGEMFQSEPENRPDDIEFLKQFAVAWDLDEEFNDENIKEALELFPQIIVAFTYGYMQALTGNRAKN